MLCNTLKAAIRPTQNALSLRALSIGACCKSKNINQEPPKEQFLTSFEGNIIDYNDPDYLPLPEYPARPNEPIDVRKARLLYQSRKRGMLENDLLLSTFASRYLKGFDAEQTAQYDQLINGVSNDWDIYYWATETKPTPALYDTQIMRLLKEHVRNVEKEERIRQPDLSGDGV